MNVLIISSSSANIDPYYLDIAKYISSYLANRKWNLVFGGASYSMMGTCYQEFISKGCKIYAYTIKKYAADLSKLEQTEKNIVDSTFDLKKSMYQKSDAIIALPGGTGTLSELYSFIEENRFRDKIVPIVIYNENDFYKSFLKQLELLKEKKFNNNSIYNYFKVANTKEEFEQLVEGYLEKGRI